MPAINGGEGADLAPVIPLFGRDSSRSVAPPRATGEEATPRTAADQPWHSSWANPDRERRTPVFREDAPDPAADACDGGAAQTDPSEVRDAAEAVLLRKLRTRQLSVSESRGVLIGAGMTTDAADDLLAQFERLGYIDDTALAEQLVRAAVERKGQGRQVISPLLTRRGIPRDVVDSVLSQLPDDDLERALDFARTKARSLGARDRETALRRLLGQLARRGYPSSVSMAAARQALDEV